MTDTIRTQHPRCHRCKTRLTVHGVCLSCEPPRQPVDGWRAVRVVLMLLVSAACLAFAAWLASGCSPCEVQTKYDGGATARPYYATGKCWWSRERVLCDSPDRLPNATCPPKEW